jgi:hypothetical protein
MLETSIDNGIFGILAILLICSLLLLHYLLFREYVHQERIHIRRLKAFENLIVQEIHRSQSLSKSVEQLRETESKTDEKLQLVKLQVEGMKVRETNTSE